ncbi:MBL fold metallo-hydrolase [Micromonospora purpureochromogenes]|uniref:MBL fold metallo-hydrolase n=1 Tax=Micromonospora purpureochromogenes TaxID=47872 RepID=UPI0033179858
MRLKLGRPDLHRYAARFDVPPAAGRFAAVFLGVSTLLLDDGESAILTDGFFSRPSLLKVAFSRIAPDQERIAGALARAGLSDRRLDAVVPVHTHFDHVLDSAVVAERTNATLVGGESAANVGRGHGLPPDRIRVVTPGEQVTSGAFTLGFVASEHCPPDRFPGHIAEPVVPPVRARAYRCGEAWSLLVRHDSGRTALVQGSAGFVPGALEGHRADVAYLGVGQLGARDEGCLTSYWAQTVRTVGARRVVLTHWDDFFRPLDRPPRALPYAGDDLDTTMRVLGRLADRDGVALHLPTTWRREDPWSGLT